MMGANVALIVPWSSEPERLPSANLSVRMSVESTAWIHPSEVELKKNTNLTSQYCLPDQFDCSQIRDPKKILSDKNQERNLTIKVIKPT